MTGLSKDQHVVVAVGFVTRNDYLFVRVESFGHFVELRILPSDLDFASESFFTVCRQDEYPTASGALVECPARDQQRLDGLSEFEVNVIGLPRPDVVGALAFEMEIDLELSALHFRVDLRDFQTEFDSLPFEFGVQAGMDFIRECGYCYVNRYLVTK